MTAQVIPLAVARRARGLPALAPVMGESASGPADGVGEPCVGDFLRDIATGEIGAIDRIGRGYIDAVFPGRRMRISATAIVNADELPPCDTEPADDGSAA